MEFEFRAKFEDCDVKPKDLLDGWVTVTATEDDWELGAVWVYAGQNGFAKVQLAERDAKRVRDWLMASPSFRLWVDEEHATYLPDRPKRANRITPAWVD